MINEDNYMIETETADLLKKKQYWDTGIGLNKVDHFEPSKYLIDLSKKNISGELTYTQIETLLKTYYEEQDLNNIHTKRKYECDFVSVRTARLLENKSFGFNPITIKNIHKYLLKDIYDFAGNYRKYNITEEKIMFFTMSILSKQIGK